MKKKTNEITCNSQKHKQNAGNRKAAIQRREFTRRLCKMHEHHCRTHFDEHVGESRSYCHIQSTDTLDRISFIICYIKMCLPFKISFQYKCRQLQATQKWTLKARKKELWLQHKTWGAKNIMARKDAGSFTAGQWIFFRMNNVQIFFFIISCDWKE